MRNFNTVRYLICLGICLPFLLFAKVRDLAISNPRPAAVNIAFTTNDSVNCEIQYGLTTALGNIVSESGESDDTHLIEISNLATETMYYYEIHYGSGIDDNSGNYYTFFTTPSDQPSLTKIVGGEVFQKDGITPAEGCLILMELKQSGNIVTFPLATKTMSNGGFSFNIADFRNLVFPYNLINAIAGDILELKLFGVEDGALYDNTVTLGNTPQNIGQFTLSFPELSGSLENNDNSTPNISDIEIFAFVENKDDLLYTIECNAVNYSSGSWTFTTNGIENCSSGDSVYINFYNAGNLQWNNYLDTLLIESVLDANVVLNQTELPAAPPNFSVTEINSTTVELKWIGLQNQTYRIYRKRSTFNDYYQRIDDPTGISSGVSGSAYTDNNRDGISAYDYLIISQTSSGEFSPLGREKGSINVNIKFFIEGAYNSGSMNTILLAENYLPKIQPYNSGFWNYQGAENVAVLPDNVVDWILVELRTGISTETNIATRTAFLKTDGSVVELDGGSQVNFAGIEPGDYYLVIKHRNHLSIMSSSVQSLVSGISGLYDFTTGTDKYFGSDAKQLEASLWGMYTGDANGNGQVQNDDKNIEWQSEVGLAGYKGSDFNLNGQVQNDDKNIYWNGNVGKGTQVP